MKRSAYILLNTKHQTNLIFPREQSFGQALKGIFIKKAPIGVEETFSAQELLSRIKLVFLKAEIKNIVRISYDNNEFHLDKSDKPDDLEAIIDEFILFLQQSYEKIYDTICLISETVQNNIDIAIELIIRRTHPINELPVQIGVSGIPKNPQDPGSEQAFNLFVDKIEQELRKYIDFGDQFKRTSGKLTPQENNLHGPGNFNQADDIFGPGDFFPLFGISLGQTSVKTLAGIGIKAESPGLFKRPYNYYTVQDINFWHNGKVADFVYLSSKHSLPLSWSDLGLSWDLSFENCKKLFQKLNYSIEVVKNSGKNTDSQQKIKTIDIRAIKKLKNNKSIRIKAVYKYDGKNNLLEHAALESLSFKV
jgi:hypothetical protein